jgi:uncharacterized membrane protein YphA (DoxX/SURF4 family)
MGTHQLTTRRHPECSMNPLTWLLQIVLGLWFLAIGVIHLVMPAGLPDQMSWMHDLSTAAHWAAGVAEIAGGLGLILPSLTRIRPALTPLAAAGLVVVMLGAAVWHVGRGETQSVGMNLVLALLLVVVARVRWRTHPIEPR